MYQLTDAIYIKMQERLIQKYQRWDHTRSIQKQQSAGIWKEYWRLSSYERIIREIHQNCLLHKGEISYDKPSTCKKRWEIFV